MWTHDLDPVALTVLGYPVHWYGLAYSAGFLVTMLDVRAQAMRGRLPLAPRAAESIVLWALAGVIVGGRLGAVVLYYPAHFLAHPAEVVMPWRGGMSFYGAVVGCVLAGIAFARRHGIAFLALADAVAVPAMLAQAFGRIGNFVNGELYGKATDLPWGVVFPRAGDGLPRHPTQLYEAAADVAIAAVLWVLRDRTRSTGRTFGLCLVLLAGSRFAVELVRVPDAAIGPLTLGQVLALPMLAAGAWLLLRSGAAVDVDALQAGATKPRARSGGRRS